MTDPINNLTPGVETTPEQKKALADANARESAEAQRLASEHTARDRAEGRGELPINTVANMLKKKLEVGDIQPPEAGTRSTTKR